MLHGHESHGAAESRAALDRQIEEYLPLRRAMQEAAQLAASL